MPITNGSTPIIIRLCRLPKRAPWRRSEKAPIQGSTIVSNTMMTAIADAGVLREVELVPVER